MNDFDYKIYVLIHPITGLVFYVGQTQKILATRLFSHCYAYSNIKNPRDYKTEVLLDLAKINRFPIIEQIDSAESLKEAKEKELEWIFKLKNEGFPLTNKEVNPKRKFEVVYTEKYPYGICVVKGEPPPDEIVLFSRTRDRDEFDRINGTECLKYKWNYGKED